MDVDWPYALCEPAGMIAYPLRIGNKRPSPAFNRQATNDAEERRMKRLAIALGTGVAMALVAVTTHPTPAPAYPIEPGRGAASPSGVGAPPASAITPLGKHKVPQE